MTDQAWRPIDQLMRILHLYLGLFLAPWLLLYATSAFLLNHDDAFRNLFGVLPPGWAVIREVALNPNEIPRDGPQTEAAALLDHLNLRGPYRVTEDSGSTRLVIQRYSGSGDYRISWLRTTGRAVVEQQRPSSAYGFIHALHFQVGYGFHHPASSAWAMIVDAITVSIWLWVISGFYFWLRKPRRRLREAVAAVTGIGICLSLMTLLYR